MKCKNCGAEVTGRFCSYCGSEIPQQPVNIVNNYYGGNNNINQGQNADTVYCTQCGHNGVEFKREQVYGSYRTIGMCRYCGNTWVVSKDQNALFNFDAPAFSAPVRTEDTNASPKNRLIALLLCLFFGAIGLHHFYSGRIGMGIVYIFTVGFWGIGVLIDLILIIVGKYKDSSGRYITRFD